MLYILIILLILLIVVWLFVKWKRLKLDCVTMVTGGVKTGKSTLCVHLAIREYKKVHRKWWFQHYILMRKDVEEPLLYSNIPLTCPYVPLTHALISRKERFRYKSIVYICEASLIADSMTYKDDLLNENIDLFIRLFGHMTRGGKCFVDTQSVNSLHYGFKKNVSRNLYIYHLTKWIPFVLVFKVRELFYSDDNSVINVSSTDIEDDMKYLIISKRVWKKFDCYAYSVFTDKNRVEDNEWSKDNKRDLKVRDLVSFRDFKTIKNDYIDYQKESEVILKNENKKNKN